jgi:hypothetical protein
MAELYKRDDIYYCNYYVNGKIFRSSAPSNFDYGVILAHRGLSRFGPIDIS